MQPHLEYYIQLWASQYIKSVKVLECVQRSAQKLVTWLEDIFCEKRLRALRLPSVEKRRLRGNLTALCRALRRDTEGGAGLCSWELMAGWKGHRALPEEGQMGIGNHFFTVRVLNYWNRLPGEVVWLEPCACQSSRGIWKIPSLMCLN